MNVTPIRTIRHRIEDDGTVFRDLHIDLVDDDGNKVGQQDHTLTITPADTDERFADESARTKRIVKAARDPEALKVWAAKQAEA